VDYGHPLRFGTFLTPAAGAPQRTVELAQLSEELGFDLVTFQDHPYQPAFLDTWTLLSYVAASTTRIQLAPNVLNLPLRPAPVTARAAASLDLLSGGRFVLGLGAGGFWDAIEAMGTPRLTPGQSIEALGEAIDLIRATWRVDDRTPLRGGEHYPVRGAKRGPAPAHDVPIWVGALKPRALRLVGRQADGWLPSLAYLGPGDLAAGNARIDDAAADAGRHPHEIVRLLNVSGREGVEQLAAFALEDGVSTFVVASDDPAHLARFADEVVPAVRALVDEERTTTGTTPAGRSARAVALRRPGIAYDDLPESLRERAVEPGDFAYREVRSTYARGGSPGLVVRPRTVDEVVDAVAFARRHTDLPLGLRSGGHGISGRSTNDGGLVIDLGALDGIEVLDEESRRVRVGPGARWSQVAAHLAPYGWAISSGDHGGVGVGGLATAGGIGFLGREHGLTIDRLVAAEVVIADGSVVRASAEENPDLFWAVRGAGANVGAVVAFELEAASVGDVGWAQLSFDASDVASLVAAFGREMTAAPRDTTLFLVLSSGPRQPGPSAYVYGVVDSDDPDVVVERLQPFARIAPLTGQQVRLAPYAAVMAGAPDGPHDGQGEPQFRSALVRSLDGVVAEAVADLVGSGAAPWFQVRSVGGAIADVPPDATAYAHRGAAFSITAAGSSTLFDRLWARLAEHAEGLYLSFDSRADDALVHEAYPPATLARVREVKRRYDPDALFRDNFPVA